MAGVALVTANHVDAVLPDYKVLAGDCMHVETHFGLEHVEHAQAVVEW